MAEQDDQDVVIRHHNRILRKVNKALRSSHKLTQEYNDALFEELCNHNSEAELALRKLWKEGGFQPPCGPEDYDMIVDSAINALNRVRYLEALEPAKCSN